jgi:mono/diheme cytochrome c family protein
VLRRTVPALFAVLALAAAGCGGGESTTGRAGADVARGKDLFVSGCGSCHTLADAGAQGKVGPNLDDAFGFDREQCFDDSSFFDVTLAQIDIPSRSGAMPPDIYKGQDAVNVAAYVASVAGIERQCPTAGE